VARVDRAADDFDVVHLLGLLKMKLNSYRLKDKVHVLDMLNVGLIDTSWLSSPLATRRSSVASSLSPLANRHCSYLL